nr:Chain L, BAM8-22 [Homo sapiens]
PEWWMDYQKRY